LYEIKTGFAGFLPSESKWKKIEQDWRRDLRICGGLKEWICGDYLVIVMCGRSMMICRMNLKKELRFWIKVFHDK
jgi:hypothetical protein